MMTAINRSECQFAEPALGDFELIALVIRIWIKIMPQGL
jgi:hypothetical protein